MAQQCTCTRDARNLLGMCGRHTLPGYSGCGSSTGWWSAQHAHTSATTFEEHTAAPQTTHVKATPCCVHAACWHASTVLGMLNHAGSSLKVTVSAYRWVPAMPSYTPPATISTTARPLKVTPLRLLSTSKMFQYRPETPHREPTSLTYYVQYNTNKTCLTYSLPY